MKTILAYLFLTLFLLSCNQKNQDDDEMPALYSPPIIIPLNTTAGYAVNQFSGDTIQPVINSAGDTLISGIPIPTQGRVLDPSIPARAEKIATRNPINLPKSSSTGTDQIHPEVIPVNKDSLHTFTPGVDSSSFVMINSMGDTVPTGVPVPIKGKVVQCSQFPPVRALPPRIKEHAAFNIRHLDQYMGLNSGITKVIMDREGHIWIGMNYGGGLCRYDGNSFIQYSVREGLSSNNVRHLFEDSKGNIWIATRGGGLIRYDGYSFTIYTEEEGLNHNDVVFVTEDSQENIWFGTWGGGAGRIANDTVIHFTIREGIPYRDTTGRDIGYDVEIMQNVVHSILEDKEGNFWFATIDGGICMFDGRTFTHLSEEDGMTSDYVLYLLQDKRGDLWCSTNNGLSVYDGTSITRISEKEGLSFNYSIPLLEDHAGNIWTGNDETGLGVDMYDGHEISNYSESDGLTSSEVWSIIEDSNGTLWFGTTGDGVYSFQPNSFRHYHGVGRSGRADRIMSGYIGSIIEDRYDTVWFHGIYYFDGIQFIDHSEEMERYRLKFQDSQGNWWFSQTGGGLNRYDGEYLTGYTEESGLIYRHIMSVTEDIKGNLWISAMHDQGLCMFDGVTFTHFIEGEGLSSQQITAVRADSRGNVWLATADRGISKYDGNSFTHYTEKEGLSDNSVNNIMEDSQGNMWFGTMNSGVSIFDGEAFAYISEREGLTDNDARSIMEDSLHHIWIGTRRGLNCVVFNSGNLMPSGDHDSIVIYTFTEEDGLISMNFLEQYSLLDSRNRLWWGTDRCVTMLDLDHYRLPESPPSNVDLIRLDINGEFVDFSNLEEELATVIEYDSVVRFKNYPLNLRLPYRLNHLTFYFSSIDWIAPHKIQYSYRIKGVDRSWSIPSSESKADYRNLPQGRHTLIVRAIGAAQKWSEPFEYSFRIRAPWWFSWWAYALYGMMLIGIFLAYRNYLLKRARLRSEVEIERMEKEKVLEMDHMKSRFFANISHEFRTPLTLILGPIEQLLKKSRKEIVIRRDEAGILHRNARRLQQLINQLLDLSKLETGNVSLQVEEGNLVDFVRTIVLSFLSLAESKEIRYRYSFPEKSATVYFDRDKVEKIVTNLISNAFKFTPEKGAVTVHMSYKPGEQQSPGFAEISVADTGKGIPEDQLNKIFDRFYQVSSADTRDYEGTGIGLSLTRELTNIYRGEISVDSKPGKGSRFTVSLPVSRDAFRDEEIIMRGSEEIQAALGFDYQMEESLVDTDEPDDNRLAEDEFERPVILIVEDNADLRKYISGNLVSKYQLSEAENGSIGFEEAVKSIPDLILTDLMMPEMDGIELCNRLRNEQATSHIPVIMLTAKADKESKLEGLRTGADDYLVKPFDADELLVRVENLIRQRKNLRDKFQREFIETDPFTNVIPDIEEEFITRIIDCIQKHLSETDFGVEQLAGELGFSRSQLYRKVRSLTGYVPNKFMRNIRLKQAVRMFHAGNRNITQVLYSVGFNTPSYFSESFRELYGMNPSDYLKQISNESPQ